MFPWAAAIGAAASLGGSAMSAFGNKGSAPSTDWNYANWQAQRDDTYLQRRVADGAAAGLSPLASIGATGGGGSIPQPVQGGSMGSQMNWEETGSQIGNAIKEILNSPEIARQRAIKDRMDDISLRQAEADLDLTRARSRSIIDAASHPTRGLAASSDDLKIKGPEATALMIGGQKIPPSRFSDAQDIQNRYGELVSNGYGIGLLGYDASKAYVDSLPRRWEETKQMGRNAYEWFQRNFKGFDPAKVGGGMW